MLLAEVVAAAVLRPAWVGLPPGRSDAAAWRGAAHEQFADTDVYLVENGKSVYVAFKAKRVERDEGDAVRVYLWSDRAAYRFSVDAKGERFSSSSRGSVPAWSGHVQPDADGYWVTMQLPQALFSGGGQSRWLVQFARVLPQHHVAYTWPSSDGAAGNVLYAAAFEARAEHAFSLAAKPQAIPTVAPAANVRELWPSGSVLAPPAVAAGALGVAVSQSADAFAFTGVDAQNNDGSQHNAQSLAWTSSDGRTSAALQRVADTSGTSYDVSQAVSLAYDNQQNVRVSAAVAADRGTNVQNASQAQYGSYDFSLYGKNGSIDMRWDVVGPQYAGGANGAPAPGTTGYTLALSRAFGNVSLDAGADRYRDDFGNLASASQRAAISAALSPNLTFDVNAAANAATQYTTLPFAQTGAQLQYGAGAQQAAASYSEEHYDGGIARELDITGSFAVPLLGTLQLAHRQTALFGAVPLLEPQESSSASLLHRLASGSISLGYQYAAGGAANITFSFQDRLPFGLLRATYYNPNTLFSTPNFSLKFVAF
jgi:hypothetical protein